MKANELLNKRISERTKGAKLQEERDKEKAKNKELEKRITILIQSRKKWRDRYNKEKEKNESLKYDKSFYQGVIDELHEEIQELLEEE